MIIRPISGPSAAPEATRWLGKLANLNAAKTPGLGVAPHKSLLIFSVMDLIESGDIRDRSVVYNADLVTRFRDYWELVVDRRKNRPEITMPFNALGSDRDAIRERFDEHGQPSKSKLTTRLCHLDPELFDIGYCLQPALLPVRPPVIRSELDSRNSTENWNCGSLRVG